MAVATAWNSASTYVACYRGTATRTYVDSNTAATGVICLYNYRLLFYVFTSVCTLLHFSCCNTF